MGEDFAREVERAAREEPLVSDLTYDLRSGEPDFIDKQRRDLTLRVFAGSAVAACCACASHGPTNRMPAEQEVVFSEAQATSGVADLPLNPGNVIPCNAFSPNALNATSRPPPGSRDSREQQMSASRTTG